MTLSEKRETALLHTLTQSVCTKLDLGHFCAASIAGDGFHIYKTIKCVCSHVTETTHTHCHDVLDMFSI